MCIYVAVKILVLKTSVKIAIVTAKMSPECAGVQTTDHDVLLCDDLAWHKRSLNTPVGVKITSAYSNTEL